MKLSLGALRSFIREAVNSDCWGSSHPDEMYEEQLIDDSSYNKQSTYVPDDVKKPIKRWLRSMGLSGSKKKRMPFEELLGLEKRLEQNLVDGRISGRQYANEWDDVLSAAGWTPEEYDTEQDRCWDYVDMLRAMPEKPHYVN